MVHRHGPRNPSVADSAPISVFIRNPRTPRIAAMTDQVVDPIPVTPYLHPERLRLQPIRALRAFNRLIRDKEDTAQVFEIMRALTGQAVPRGYRRLLRTVEGGRQAFLGRELVDRLSDRAWLETFAPGTVGAAYREFMGERGFMPDGLVEVERKVVPAIDAPHPVAWYSRRLRDVHDIWHVLAGYETDALGEACVVSFSFPQTGQLGFGFIGWGAAREIHRENPAVPARRAALEAWRNGRRAAWLPALDYEALFAERLQDARRRLNIRPPTIYNSVPREVRQALKLRAPAMA
jgi:ubiquinone biosynthesis protein COQ4